MAVLCRLGLHVWVPAPEPEGWKLSLYHFMYRRCYKCNRHEAKGPPHANANFWQKIEVPYPEPKTWKQA